MVSLLKRFTRPRDGSNHPKTSLYDKPINTQGMKDLSMYLTQAIKNGDKFYVQKEKQELKSLNISPSRIDLRLVQYLLELEDSGAKIYVKKPGLSELWKVSFRKWFRLSRSA